MIFILYYICACLYVFTVLKYLLVFVLVAQDCARARTCPCFELVEVYGCHFGTGVQTIYCTLSM